MDTLKMLYIDRVFPLLFGFGKLQKKHVYHEAKMVSIFTTVHVQAHVYCKSKNHKQEDKTNFERAVTSDREEKEMSEGGEERVFICLYNILLHLIFFKQFFKKKIGKVIFFNFQVKIKRLP